MKIFENVPRSRRKLFGKLLGSFKDLNGLNFLFGLRSSRGCLLTWTEFDGVLVTIRNGLSQIYRTNMTFALASNDTIKVSYSWAKQFVMSCRGPTSSSQVLISCSNLSGSWVCLSTDGSVRYEDGSPAAGGIGILDGLGILIDSLEAAKAIQERPTGGSNLTLIRRILQLLSQIHHWSIWHIPREDNQEADSLVKLAYVGSQGL
ncbi:hypothetical protein Gotri_001401 [Gossypium trilobum]|uniref:RNase H type-1 domain-containing protein n=1 Tax=Gossypium trilobum TaxID=34281 RepID=A0A7J9FEZ9_9ROSI|nr:hypothetical protein [Gossypium trilobum]